MTEFSTREAARRLGLSPSGLSKHIRLGKIPAPKMAKTSSSAVHLWTKAAIDCVRRLLPKIKNGRKTRYQKKQSATGTQQLAKPKRRPKSQGPTAKSRKRYQTGSAR